MRLRLTKVDEFQFLTCVKNGIWGSNSARFADWQIGDLLAIIVDKQIAGLSEVSGQTFKSDKIVWDNGLFQYRIPIKFTYLFDKQHRPQLIGNIRNALINAWSSRYGWGILNQQLLDDKNAEIVVNEITNKDSQNLFFQQNISALLIAAKQARRIKTLETSSGKRGRPKKNKAKIETETTIDVPFEKEHLSNQEESLHSKAQYLLSKVGLISGCSNFIASNDRKRKYNNIELNTLTIPNLPNLGLSKDATDRISRIDVIWLKQNAAICAFEVETSTSIFSGLLRMSDLLAEIPNLNIKLYIVAQKDRESKVLSELSRPTFKKIGMHDFCEFISIEDLNDLLNRIEKLSGHIHPSILDTISIGIDDNNSNKTE